VSGGADGNAFIEWVLRYRDNPVLFAKEVLEINPDPWQADLMNAIATGERRVAVRSSHGVGKSLTVSILSIWFLMTRYPCKIVITAPTSAQLFDALFAEIKTLTKALPDQLQQLLNVKADRVELVASPDAAFISARTSRAETPESLQGVHSENVLLIADEASGIPEAVFAAASGSMSGDNAHTVLLGNPTRSSGFFYDVFHRMASQWRTFHVSGFDSPRVSQDYIDEMRMRYGENSNVFRVRVLGEFPLADDDTILPMEMIEAAMARDITLDDRAPSVWGVDIARFGSDKTALAKRQGSVVTEIRTWSQMDLMQTSGIIKAEYDALSPHQRPVEILVDSIGLGAGVVDRLRELGLPVRGINVSESPSMKGTYANLRAELWFLMKAFLEQRNCKLPRNMDLVAELASPRFSFTSNGKLQAETKDSLRKRGLRSPDLADAVCLTLAGDASTAIYGVSASGSWNKPLKRGLKGVA
jgi:phage terminase large subunit